MSGALALAPSVAARRWTLELKAAVVPQGGPIEAGRGVIEGYASLFGVADLSGDVVMAGAFAASLRRRGVGGIKLLWQHDPATPIGRWIAVSEDGKGLRVRGEIALEAARGRDAFALVRAGALDGLSIGFRTVKALKDVKSGLRRLTEVDLWEISLVTFPMLPGARITGLSDPAGTSELDRRLARATAALRA